MIILMQQVLIVCSATSLTFHLFASRGEGEPAPQSPPAPAAEHLTFCLRSSSTGGLCRNAASGSFRFNSWFCQFDVDLAPTVCGALSLSLSLFKASQHFLGWRNWVEMETTRVSPWKWSTSVASSVSTPHLPLFIDPIKRALKETVQSESRGADGRKRESPDGAVLLFFFEGDIEVNKEHPPRAEVFDHNCNDSERHPGCCWIQNPWSQHYSGHRDCSEQIMCCLGDGSHSGASATILLAPSNIFVARYSTNTVLDLSCPAACVRYCTCYFFFLRYE